jgi:type IX secretion system PorP/SprF family membrane protein
MKKLILSGVFLGVLVSVYGQQWPAISQYMINKFSVNPAVAGSTDDFTIAASFRKSWAGMNAGPLYQYLNADLKVAERMGVGINLFNLSQGPLSSTGFGGTYAYHIPLSDGQYLAFGLTGVIYQYSIKTEELIFFEPDPLESSLENVWAPDAAFGTYYYSENYYIGYSLKQMFQWNVKDGIIEFSEVRNHYLMGGYKHVLSEEFSIEPSAILKFKESIELQADIGIITTYKNMVWGGMIFRPMSSVSILLGFDYDPITFGYAYDMTLADIKANSFGSHELMLIFRLNNFLMK